MKRRAFLTGLIATTVLADCGSVVEAVVNTGPQTAAAWEAYMRQWMEDASAELVKTWEDQIIYGVSAYRTTETYPFIERIDPVLLERPRTIGGLFP